MTDNVRLGQEREPQEVVRVPQERLFLFHAAIGDRTLLTFGKNEVFLYPKKVNRLLQNLVLAVMLFIIALLAILKIVAPLDALLFACGPALVYIVWLYPQPAYLKVAVPENFKNYFRNKARLGEVTTKKIRYAGYMDDGFGPKPTILKETVLVLSPEDTKAIKQHFMEEAQSEMERDAKKPATSEPSDEDFITAQKSLADPYNQSNLS